MASKLVKGWMALRSPRGATKASGGSGGAAAGATPERSTNPPDRSGRSTPANRTPRKQVVAGAGANGNALDVDSAG
jgi:hypothetical protein